MGLGPNKTSLLVKLGLKPAHEMELNELTELVSKDRDRRSLLRAVVVMRKLAGPKKPQPTRTLEEFGLAPVVIEKLRATGKSEAELITLIARSGLI